MKAAFVLASILGLAACGPELRDGNGNGNGDGNGDGNGNGDGDGVPRQCNKMDLMFVIDDSGSMSEEQANLAANFPMFAQVLSSYTTPDGDKIDFRVAVTTTGRDLSYSISLGSTSIPQNESGDNGALRNNCNLGKRWIEPSDANMPQLLGCRANVGTSGPSFEMPLLMSKWALSERVFDGTNVGFLRDDALLGIVMLTDEDDASTTQNNFTVTVSSQPPVDWHPADQVAFLDALKGHRSRWAAGVIAGDGACSSSFGNATDAPRLKQFVQLANGTGSTQATFSSICDGDLTAALQKIVTTFQDACGGIIL